MKKNYLLIIIIFLWAHVATGQKPVANFTASADPTCAGSCISFIDESTNNPTSWKWAFAGATPATSSAKDPVNICYGNSGSFDVRLVVSNSSGSDSLTINNFMVVNPDIAPSVVVYPEPGDSGCMGTNFIFYAYAANGGTNPDYQWYVNSDAVGRDTNVYSSATINNGDTVTVHLLNATGQCILPDSAVSYPVWMMIWPNVHPAVTIVAHPGNMVTSGTNVIFIADTSGAGTDPTFQWYINGNPVGTNSIIYSSDALNNGDVITCVMTPGALCSMPAMATSNQIVMQVVTGVEQLKNEIGLFISPNPATNLLTLHTSFNNEHTTVSIMNVLGQEAAHPPTPSLREGESAMIDISALAAGVYFLQLRSAGGSATKMFVKE